tara:strand:- start:33902 stop:34015 length:114 start_codon:yes stop_codon:yes gene_type:complete
MMCPERKVKKMKKNEDFLNQILDHHYHITIEKTISFV